ncbi:MAG: RNA polymerase sigma factor [Pseudomonadota bacterium]
MDDGSDKANENAGAVQDKLAEARRRKRTLMRTYASIFQKLSDGIRARYGPGPPDPEDVAQAAFEKLAQRENLHDIKDVYGYLWIVSRNIILSEKRKEAVRNDNSHGLSLCFFGETSDNFEPERVLIAKNQISIVMEVLSNMGERRRKIFMLVRVNGLTPAQAGKRCGVSRTSAVRHIAEATKLIAAAFVTPDDKTALLAAE